MRRRTLTLLVLVGCVAAALFPAAVATPAAPPYAATLERTVGYLQDVQNTDGGFPGQASGVSDIGFSAWVTMALAAAGINPKDQAKAGGADAYTYLFQRTDKLTTDTTDYERAMLAVQAACASPRDFGGRDLVALTLSRQLPSGGFTHVPNGKSTNVNDTIFAILPLTSVPGDDVRAAIEQAVTWLVGAAKPSGGWAATIPSGPVDTDMTGAAIQALRAAGHPDTAAERNAWAYLEARQGPTGGFAAVAASSEENTATTAWVAQAMWAAGIDPDTWRTAQGKTPLDFLADMQQPDGSIRWKRGEDKASNLNPVWMTAYALPALTGHPLPIPCVPPSERPPAPETSPDGVTAGGGGNGAPLFTRPQGQSDGEAAGGVRHVANATKNDEAERRTQEKKAKPKPKPVTQTRRSPNAKTLATGTAQSNGVADSGVTPVASAATVPGGTDTEQRTDPEPRGKDRGDGGGARQVTGRLLGRAPAGVSGQGKDQGLAPGLRSRTPDEGSPTTAIVLSILLAAAALGGARLEGQPGRGALPA